MPRLRTALAAVSLLLCLASCAMWVRGIYRADDVMLGRVEFTSAVQQIWITVWDARAASEFRYSSVSVEGPVGARELLPQVYTSKPLRPLVAYIPCWMLVLAFAAPPLLWWRRRRRVRTAAGFPVQV
jgi:hypothetical protein